MSQMFNEEFNDDEKNMKNIYTMELGKQACGFFGDNSKQTALDYSPHKYVNNEKKNFHLTENSNLYSLKTMDNTEANFKKNNFKSSFQNEFKFLSTESTKISEKNIGKESNNNINNLIGSNNEILFSGYFGQKYGTKKINDDKFSKITSNMINPFSDIVEEENKKITNDDNQIASKNMEKTVLEAYANNNTFMEDAEKNFNDFLNFRKIDCSTNLNPEAYKDGNGFCRALGTGINKDLCSNNDDNDNKKQFNSLVRSVTISSLNSYVNNNTNNKSNLISCSASNMFDNFCGFSQNSCYLPKKKSNFIFTLFKIGLIY